MGALDSLTGTMGFSPGTSIVDIVSSLFMWIVIPLVVGGIAMLFYFMSFAQFRAIVHEDKLNGWFIKFDKIRIKRSKKTGKETWKLIKGKDIIPKCPDDLIYPTKGNLIKGIIHIYKDAEGGYSYCTVNKFKEMVLHNEEGKYVNRAGEVVEDPVVVKQPIIEPEPREWRELAKDEILQTANKYSQVSPWMTYGLPIIGIFMFALALIIVKKGVG